MGEIVAAVRARGLEPVFVITPSLNPKENFASLPGSPRLLRLNDPRQYPQLYDPDLYYDPWHFNPRGAALFTRLLAERFAAELKTP